MRNIDVLTILVDQVDQEFSKICGHSVNRHPIIRPSPFQAGSADSCSSATPLEEGGDVHHL